ncbi:MAG: TatD family hydrolase, partial [Candidatus Glassbacteria bacterium]
MKGPLPPLIDSHCHLTEPIYSGKEEEYLDRAYQAGVKGVVSVGIDIETSRKAIEQAERFPDVYATIGLHPHNASTIDVKALDELGELVSHEKVVAVGETGLDYHYDLSPRDLQRKAFAAQVILARKAHRPLVVHSREAVGDCLEVIAGYGGGEVKGVFHCFSGTESEAFDILKLGFYLSFA